MRKASTNQPLDAIVWEPRDKVSPNDYNPNKQPPPEFRLLKISILQDGWTQPIVADRKTGTIIDGEHRWRVAADKEVAALTSGLIPVVYLDGDLSHRMMSTIRHNRARGEHCVAPMSAVVRSLLEAGNDQESIEFLLQMEDEEVERLAERSGMPEVISREKPEFSNGWIPGSTVSPNA